MNVFAAGGHGTERKCVQYMSNIVFPLGIDSFEKNRTEGYYYIDKTEIIAELLRKTFEGQSDYQTKTLLVKTLAMDTMASFLISVKIPGSCFPACILKNTKEICGKWQNQWPVLLSLKEVDDKTFDQATKNWL